MHVNAPLDDWCPWRDSNAHTFRRQILSLVCLPIPPQGQQVRQSRGNAKQLGGD